MKPAVIPKKAKGRSHKSHSDHECGTGADNPRDLPFTSRIWGRRFLRTGRKAAGSSLCPHKNNREIPLNYESEGIKKIVSILQLLIVVYNQGHPSLLPLMSSTLGVFEYLLGETAQHHLREGEGTADFIFTSHNLRPLETLDRGFIAFTTTNPHKRYVRMTNVKENNKSPRLLFQGHHARGAG